MKIPVGLLGWIVAVVLVVILFFVQTCETPCPEEKICDDFDTAAFIETLPIKYKDSLIYVPKYVTVYKDTGSIKYVEVPVGIDSLEIALEYFSWLVYEDSLLYDTNGHIVLVDSVSRNKIQSRHFKEFEIYPHLKVVTVTKIEKEELHNIFMLGGGITGNQHSVGFSVGAGLMNKKRQVLLLSYDLLRSEIQVQYYLPIRFRKR